MHPAAVLAFPIIEPNVEELEHLRRFVGSIAAGACAKSHHGVCERRLVGLCIVTRIPRDEEKGDEYGERITLVEVHCLGAQLVVVADHVL